MRYLHLFAVRLRLSLALGLQYRWNFLVDGAIALLWTGLGVVPLYVALHDRPPVAGWTFDRALVVVGFFTLLRGVLDGAVNPSLLAGVEQIREGTLDFLLLKPADAQFLVSTARVEPWKGLDVVAGLGILAAAFRLLGRAPSLPQAALAAAIVACAVVVLYSIGILVIAAAFWVVRLDNLAFLIGSFFDFARWPVGIFRGGWRMLFTFVIPLGLMTTYPAEALLGALDARTAFASFAGTLLFATAARVVWTRAIRHYTSASS